MEQGRRGGSQENDAGDAEIDCCLGVFPSGWDEYRVESGGLESFSCEHINHSDNADGGNDFVNVDRRANHGAGCWEWNIADNICGYSGGIAEEHSDDLSICAGGDDKLFQRGIICGDSVGDDCIRHLC